MLFLFCTGRIRAWHIFKDGGNGKFVTFFLTMYTAVEKSLPIIGSLCFHGTSDKIIAPKKVESVVL